MKVYNPRFSDEQGVLYIKTYKQSALVDVDEMNRPERRFQKGYGDEER